MTLTLVSPLPLCLWEGFQLPEAGCVGSCLNPWPSPCRMALPVSMSNPDLLRHSTELFMDNGFSPLCQRMGAMVAFRRFEDFTR